MKLLDWFIAGGGPTDQSRAGISQYRKVFLECQKNSLSVIHQHPWIDSEPMSPELVFVLIAGVPRHIHGCGIELFTKFVQKKAICACSPPLLGGGAWMRKLVSPWERGLG